MVSYEGIFFEEEARKIIYEQEKVHLPEINDEIHCTFLYHPSNEELFDELVGREFLVTLIGYGCDGKNSGFEITIPKELKGYYRNWDSEKNQFKKPHITTSLTSDSKASYTKDLNFIPLERPIPVIGKFGYWIKEDNLEFLSFTPQKKD